jgi:putative heme-binding domain-containing protein
VMTGMTAGLAGVRKAKAPPSWAAFPRQFAGAEAGKGQSLARGIDVVFGDGRALEEVRRLALDDKAELSLRKAALSSLIEAEPADLRAVCEGLLKVRFLNTVALQGLVRSADPAVGKRIAASYRTFHPSERAAVVEALASRPEFAAELLDRMAAGEIPRTDLSASQARQIRGMGGPDLGRRLGEVWGELRDSPRDKAELMARLTTDLTSTRVATEDRSRGRSVFIKACSSCHRLFGSGGEIGPDLTGAGRKDLSYILSNIVDPGAVVSKDFQMTVLGLADGRVVSGIVTSENDASIAIQTAQAKVTIPRSDVLERRQSTDSLMPEGLLQTLTPQQIRDLVAYLMSDAQVDLPAGPTPE